MNSRVIIATAGSGKTERIIEEALATAGRALIVTYTHANQQQIVDRINARLGVMPPNITVMGWFAFLLAHGARPYQRVLTGAPGMIQSLNFKGERSWYTSRDNIRSYYFDTKADMYRNGVADFVCRANRKAGGAVVARLERIFNHLFIDEVQDLVGYDLDVLELLFKAELCVLAVGDPRQFTFETNTSRRNNRYRGSGFIDWVHERGSICGLEQSTENHRCVQAICDFADSIFPEYENSTSTVTELTGHDGVFKITSSEVLDYYHTYDPVVLRYNRRFQTKNLPAINIGMAKGSTYDRVLIFPTKPMRSFLADGDESKLRDRERLYVAVTRAKYSVAFVVDD